MIHEEICTYEVAKLAKEKGFPQDTSRWLRTAPCRNYYTRKGELNGDCMEIVQYMIANKTKDIPADIQTVAAPTQSLLQRWLREEKGIIIELKYSDDTESFRPFWSWQIYNTLGITLEIGEPNTTYELALEDALAYGLKNLV